jgi:hypothetical protein
MLPHYAESLAIAGNVEITQYDADFKPPHEWHCWTLDAPQIISIDSVFIPRLEVEAMRIIEAETQQVNVDTGKVKNKQKGDTDKNRTSHCIEWINRTNYEGNKKYIWLDAELRKDNPDLWGKNIETFNKWFQSIEAKPAKELLEKLKLEARQAV